MKNKFFTAFHLISQRKLRLTSSSQCSERRRIMKTQAKTCKLTIARAAALARGNAALAVCLALCTVGLGRSATAGESTIITFDAPGAGTSAGQGTFAFSINQQGAIAGYYLDMSNVYHGFVRTRRGHITTFDVSGAGTGAFQGTLPYGSNPEGAIAGFYADSSYVYHGFVRAPDGNITTFDAPDAGSTFAANINPAGVIAGDYSDVNNVQHAYVRTPDGNFTTFDAPGAGTGAFQGTFTGFLDCINPEGAMTGYSLDTNNELHGYVRARDGNITTFDAPGAGTGAGLGTLPAGIDPARTIAGEYFDASNVSHGFVRAAHGDIINVDVPGAGTGSGQGTYPGYINTRGDIVGQYVDAGGVNHGFVRTQRDDNHDFARIQRGDITTFDVPGAGSGSGQGTIPGSSDPAGGITGYYVDASGVYHAFLRLLDQ
jgi:hypothetical protein